MCDENTSVSVDSRVSTVGAPCDDLSCMSEYRDVSQQRRNDPSRVVNMGKAGWTWIGTCLDMDIGTGTHVCSGWCM